VSKSRSARKVEKTKVASHSNYMIFLISVLVCLRKLSNCSCVCYQSQGSRMKLVSFAFVVLSSAKLGIRDQTISLEKKMDPAVGFCW
jgi:hypothetical protein